MKKQFIFYKNLIITVHLFLFFSITAIAQQTLKGKVISSQENEALAGASVLLVGSEQGVETGIDGNFELTINSFPADIKISFIGFQTVTKRVESAKNQLVIVLTPSLENLNEIVVSAYQTNRKLLTTAAPVSVLQKRALQRGDNTTLIPVLNTVPGVKLDYYTYGDYRLNIRGGALAQPSVHSSGYRMYWNGIPISTASGGNPLGGLDVNFINQMEVIKGPGSTMYGAGFGGVVLVNTERASSYETSFNSDTMIGGFGTLRTSNGVNASWESGSISARHTYTESDGYRDNTATNGRVFNLFGQQYIGEKGTLSYLLNMENRKIGIAGDLDRDTFETAPETANTIQPTVFGPDKITLGVGYKHLLNENWETSIGGYYFDNQGFFKLTFPFFGIYNQEPSEGFNLRATTKLKKDLGDIKFTFDGGLEYGSSKNQSIAYDQDFDIDAAQILTTNTADTKQFLGFTQFELAFPKEFYVTLGASYNVYNYDITNDPNGGTPLTFDSNVNQIVPRLSLLKNFGQHSLYGSIGQGFSPPAAGVFINNDSSVNSNLSSATGWNYEIGGRGSSKNNRFFYDVNLYLLNIDDAIISRLFEISPGVNAERRTNAGQVRQLGAEILVGANIANKPDQFFYGSRVQLGYTYNNFEYTDYQTFQTAFDDNFNAINTPVDFSGQEIPGTIPHTVFATLDVNTSVGAYLNFTYNYYDSTFLSDQNTEKAPAYRLMNIRAGYKATLNTHFNIEPYVGVNNLGDELYSALNAYNSTFGGFFNPGYRRQFFAGIQLKYQL